MSVFGDNWRIALGGLWHETNTFAPGATSLDDFRSFQLKRWFDLVETYADTATELGGAIAASIQAGTEIVPLTYGAAVPSGIVRRAAFSQIRDWVLEDLERAGQVDAVLLVLHGALAVEDVDYPEAELVEEIRARRPGTPIAVTLDLHANLGQRLADAVDVLVTYDTFPHTDMAERGAEAHDLLCRILATGRKPQTSHVKLPLLTVPLRQDTGEMPMKGIMDSLRRAEANSRVWTISAIPGFAYSAVDRLGFSIYVAADAAAGAIADDIAEQVWESREQFASGLMSPADALAWASENKGIARGPIVLADVDDNVGGGSPGNGTLLLDALEKRAGRDAVTVIWDPEAIRHIYGNTQRRMSVEVSAAPGMGPRVRLIGDITRAGHVAYRRTGNYMTGQEVNMGMVAIVASASGDVVITDQRVPPFDADHLKVLGLQPDSYRFIVAKSAAAWKNAFGGIASHALYIQTPGYCTSNLADLHLPGPAAGFYPLNTQATWHSTMKLSPVDTPDGTYRQPSADRNEA